MALSCVDKRPRASLHISPLACAHAPSHWRRRGGVLPAAVQLSNELHIKRCEWGSSLHRAEPQGPCPSRGQGYILGVLDD